MKEFMVELTCTMRIEAENEDEAVEIARDNMEIDYLYAYVDGHDYG